MKLALSLGVVVFSASAAILWLMATVVWVSEKATDRPDATGMTPFRIVDDNGTDVLATMSKQLSWNRLAAAAACLAAICQSVSSYLYGLQ